MSEVIFYTRQALRFAGIPALYALLFASVPVEGRVALTVLFFSFWALAIWKPRLQKWIPFVAEFRRILFAIRSARALKAGNNELVALGIKSEKEIRTFPAWFSKKKDGSEVTLEVAPIAGIPPQKIIDTAKEFKSRYGAKSLWAEDCGAGRWTIHFLLIDPLDYPKVLKSTPQVEPEKMSVPCATDRKGKPYTLSFSGISGITVAGIAGSGKTAGVSSFLLPLALSPDVDLTIMDGKGGTDWSAFEPQAEDFLSISEPEDMERAVERLRTLKSEMVRRLASQKEALGQSNFWNASLAQRREAGLKFTLLVIDEAQELFQPVNQSREAKALSAEATALITTLVKRGRSAGFCVILITQKTTADAIPTAIRDNTARKIAFRLETLEGEKAILGSIPDDPDLPRATDIPFSRKGGAVVVTDDGTRVAVRFHYIPEKVQENLLIKGAQQ